MHFTSINVLLSSPAIAWCESDAWPVHVIVCTNTISHLQRRKTHF